MRNQFFDLGFVFDFYSDRGSTATPSARSNVSWRGLGIFRSKPTKCHFLRFFPFLIIHYRKNRKPRKTIFGSLVERWVLYWYSLKQHLLCSIYFADRWRCKCAIRTLPTKHVQVGKFWALLPPASNFVALLQFKFARKLRILTKLSFSATRLVPQPRNYAFNCIKQLKFCEIGINCEPTNWHRDRNCQISNDWSILSSLVNNIRYTNFFMFGLKNFSPNIDKVQIIIIVVHFWPPVIKKVEQLQRLFLVMWQMVRRSI